MLKLDLSCDVSYIGKGMMGDYKRRYYCNCTGQDKKCCKCSDPVVVSRFKEGTRARVYWCAYHYNTICRELSGYDEPPIGEILESEKEIVRY